jgi:hypothetical protein
LLVVAEAKAGFLQLAVLLVAWSCCKWLWCFLAEKEEILSWLRPLGESIKPLGEESDISPEVDEVTVVLVVSLVLREAEPPAEPVPRKTPSKTSSGAARRAWLGRPSPQSESESDESPVKGTERIWLALWKNKQTDKQSILKTKKMQLDQKFVYLILLKLKRYDVKECAARGVYWANLNFKDHDSINGLFYAYLLD